MHVVPDTSNYQKPGVSSRAIYVVTVEAVERINAGTVMEQAEHGENLKAIGSGKNVPYAGEMDLTVVSIATGQAGSE